MNLPLKQKADQLSVFLLSLSLSCSFAIRSLCLFSPFISFYIIYITYIFTKCHFYSHHTLMFQQCALIERFSLALSLFPASFLLGYNTTWCGRASFTIRIILCALCEFYRFRMFALFFKLTMLCTLLSRVLYTCRSHNGILKSSFFIILGH